MLTNDESNMSFHGEDVKSEDYDAKDVKTEYCDAEEMDRFYQENLAKLKLIREKVNWKIEKERYDILDQLHPIFVSWKGQPPNLRDIFQRKEINWILKASAINKDRTVENRRGQQIIEFVARSGYKDEPKVDEDGKPLLSRTTPIHHAARRWFPNRDTMVRELFKIFNRFDANYTDEFGFAHFHAACACGVDYVVEKFLNLGQDPNCIDRETGKPPLHVALRYGQKEVVELLIRKGADPNMADAEGWTALHVICDRVGDDDLAEQFFQYTEAVQRILQIDAQDKLGRTPLHLALEYGLFGTAELLLRRDADPSLADHKGRTPLHLICQEYHGVEHFMDVFFEVSDANQRSIEIDARDKMSRTPLQWAVASLTPHVIDVLLNRGADLTSFTFPSQIDFDERIKALVYKVDSNYKLRLASGLLSVVTHLENRGYHLDRAGTRTIMKLIVDHQLLNAPAALEEDWYDMDEEFAREAKKIMMKPTLSLYQLIRLRPAMAEKLLTCADYFEFARADCHWLAFNARSSEACAVHLCRILSRRFFRFSCQLRTAN